MTERDVVLRERAAVDRALEWVFAEARRNYGINGGIEGVDARKYIEVNHPLPTVTRPRIAKDPYHDAAEWKWDGGRLWVRWCGNQWDAYPRRDEATNPSYERIKLWADLLAQPTETVDA